MHLLIGSRLQDVGLSASSRARVPVFANPVCTGLVWERQRKAPLCSLWCQNYNRVETRKGFVQEILGHPKPLGGEKTAEGGQGNRKQT